jgi:4a-hydroxytetrahydrobiopterin dehydratase
MTSDMSALVSRKCKPCTARDTVLPQADIDSLLKELPQWRQVGDVITRTFQFPDHWHTMAFVNAVAWISHREDHHPDMSIGYNTCKVDYTTHVTKGLSENDFICAAKVDALLKL